MTQAYPIALRYRSNWYAGMIVDGTTWHYPLKAFGYPMRAMELSNRSADAQNQGHDQTQYMSDKLSLVGADEVLALA